MKHLTNSFSSDILKQNVEHEIYERKIESISKNIFTILSFRKYFILNKHFIIILILLFITSNEFLNSF